LAYGFSHWTALPKQSKNFVHSVKNLDYGKANE